MNQKLGINNKRPWAAIILVILIAGGAAWFWFAKGDGDKDVLATAKESISEAAKKAQELLPNAKKNQENLPVVNPSSDGANLGLKPGDIQGTTAQKGESGLLGVGGSGVASEGQKIEAAKQAANVETARGLIDRTTEGIAPNRTDDAVVRISFIDDLSKWMLSNYVPAGRNAKAHLTVGIQSANIRYGTGMKGLSWIGDDLPTGRIEALRYVYTPSMLNALYKLYIDRFMLAMDEAATAPQGKKDRILEPAQINEMYRLYAERFRTLSGALQGLCAIKDFGKRMDAISVATQKMVAKNSRYIEDTFYFDQAREQGNSQAEQNYRGKMLDSGQQYQVAVQERDKLQVELIDSIKNNPEASHMRDDNLYYLGQWVHRRMKQSDQALEASMQAATIFLDLAKRFDQAAAGN